MQLHKSMKDLDIEVIPVEQCENSSGKYHAADTFIQIILKNT